MGLKYLKENDPLCNTMTNEKKLKQNRQKSFLTWVEKNIQDTKNSEFEIQNFQKLS